MHCNRKKILTALALAESEGLTSLTVQEIIAKVPDVRHPTTKIQALIDSGYIEMAADGSLKATQKSLKLV